MTRLSRRVVFFTLTISLPTTNIAIADATGNRYNLPRAYKAEASSAEAYYNTVENANGVIIDVRAIQEHEGTWTDINGGHPEFSYNIPYPHVWGRPSWPDYQAQPEDVFYDAVATLVDKLDGAEDGIIDYDYPLYLLCRTGFRSVNAGNILAGGDYGPAFTNVRNVWEGYVGRYKPLAIFTDSDEVIARDSGKKNLTVVTKFTKDGEVIVKEGKSKGTGGPSAVVYMDLNGDGSIGDYDHDGWSEYQGLPVSLDNTYSWYDQSNWLGLTLPYTLP